MMEYSRRGSLIVVGTGIQLVNQVTFEARRQMEKADRVLYLMNDPMTASWISSINPNSVSLADLYGSEKERRETYEEMVLEVMEHVRSGERVCLAFYGHPGIFAFPGHEAVRRCLAEGFEARMLPGVSALDCLFADLGLDPATSGCQTFEATDFLVNRRRFDPRSLLVLWQVGSLGNVRFCTEPSRTAVAMMVDVLRRTYDAEHPACLYNASPFPFPVAGPSADWMDLEDLRTARILSSSTLVLKPKPTVSDMDVVRELDLDR